MARTGRAVPACGKSPVGRWEYPSARLWNSCQFSTSPALPDCPEAVAHPMESSVQGELCCRPRLGPCSSKSPSRENFASRLLDCAHPSLPRHSRVLLTSLIQCLGLDPAPTQESRTSWEADMEQNTWDVLGGRWISPGSTSQISIGSSDPLSMCQRCLPTPEGGNVHRIKYSLLLEFPVPRSESKVFSQGSGDSWRWRNTGTTGFSWDPVASSRNGRWFFLLDIILDILLLKTQQSSQGGLHPRKTLHPCFPENPAGIWLSRAGCTHPDLSMTGSSARPARKFTRYLSFLSIPSQNFPGFPEPRGSEARKCGSEELKCSAPS